MAILQHSFANCSRLLRRQCTGCLAALLPTPSHGWSGISTARVCVNTYAMQLIGCTLDISIRARNQYDGANNVLELGSESQLRTPQMQRPAAWRGLHSPHRHIVLPGAIGEDDKYGASLKIEGRKKSPLQDPRDFMVIHLPFHSHEEFTRIIT